MSIAKKLMTAALTQKDPPVVLGANADQGTGGVILSVPTHSDGDLLVAFTFGGNETNAANTPPSGWTEVLDRTTNPSVAVMYKVASSEPSTYTFSKGSYTFGTIISISGASTQIDVVGTVGVSTSSNNYVVPAITTAQDNALLLSYLGNSDRDPNSGTCTGGMTQLAFSSGNTGIQISFDGVSEIAGDTGTRTITLDVASNVGETKGYFMVAIYPA